jgi:hypothetical protein
MFYDRRAPVQERRARREEHDKRERHDREYAETNGRVTKGNGGILAGARGRVRGHLSVCLCCSGHGVCLSPRIAMLLAFYNVINVARRFPYLDFFVRLPVCYVYSVVAERLHQVNAAPLIR